MLPAREGDGTGLSAPGYSEVRKGDGTVLWSAGGDIPDSVVDNFEEILYEDQANTLSDFYSGDVGTFQRQTTTAQEGSYALERVPSASAADFIGSLPGDGLNRYIQTDETWRCWLRVPRTTASESDVIGVMTGNDSATQRNNGYLYLVRNDDTGAWSLEIQRYDAGASTTLDTVSGFNLSTDTWYELAGYHGSDGSINSSLYDSSGTQIGATAQNTDATHLTNGEFEAAGIGYFPVRFDEATPGGFYDNFRVVQAQ